jgi:hypothetical protein
MTCEEHLKRLGAPEEFRLFAMSKKALEVWGSCTRPDWLLWWAASTNVNGTKSIKLATHDCLIVSQPRLELVPEWAKVIADTWECDPRTPKRIKAWEEWAAWSTALSDDNTEKRLCNEMRKFRLRIPWEER